MGDVPQVYRDSEALWLLAWLRARNPRLAELSARLYATLRSR